jgi:hypothetical protein
MLEKAPESNGKKAPLYMRMYYDPCYVELARFIGYGGKPFGRGEAICPRTGSEVRPSKGD